MKSKRVDTLDELELSVHHTVKADPARSYEEVEVHAGMADVLQVPTRLVETVKTVTGVDIRERDVRCGAKIEIVDDGRECAQSGGGD